MHYILTETNRYGDQLESATIHVEGLSGFNLCSLHIIPEGSEGRKEFQGPMVPGPWPFVCTHALVIDNHGGSARERDNALKIGLGEPFRLEGCPGTFMFRKPNRRLLEGDGPRLVELSPSTGPRQPYQEV